MQTWTTVVVCVLVGVLSCRGATVPQDDVEEDGVSIHTSQDSPTLGAVLDNEDKIAREKELLKEEKLKISEDTAPGSKLTVRFPEDSLKKTANDEEDAVRSKKSPGAREQRMYLRQSAHPTTTVCIHVHSDHSVVCGPQATKEHEEEKNNIEHASARFAYQPSPADYDEESLHNHGYMRAAQNPRNGPSYQSMRPGMGMGPHKRVESLPVSPYRPSVPSRLLNPTFPMMRSEDSSTLPKPTELSKTPSAAGTPLHNVIIRRQYIPAPLTPGSMRLNCAYQPEYLPLYGTPLRTPMYTLAEQPIGNSISARLADSAEVTDEHTYYMETPQGGPLDQIVGSPYMSQMGATYVDGEGNAFMIDDGPARTADDVVAQAWDQQHLLRAAEGKGDELRDAKEQMEDLKHQLSALKEQMALKNENLLKDEKPNKKMDLNQPIGELKANAQVLPPNAQDAKTPQPVKSKKRQARTYIA